MGETNKDKRADVSSAELTADYRCAFPELSGDTLSLLLSSNSGRLLAEAFVATYNYPLARRKISACAGYFLQEATRLIQTGLYDSVISFDIEEAYRENRALENIFPNCKHPIFILDGYLIF